MRYSYRQPPKRARRTLHTSYTAIFLVAVLIVLILVQVFVPGFLSRIARQAAAPVWNSENRLTAGIGSLFEAMRSKQGLVEENRALEERVRVYDAQAAYIEALEEENKELKALLNQSRFDSLLLAPILRRPPATPYDTLIVDVGASGEARVGNRVTIGGSFVVGKLAAVEGSVGTVQLFSTPGVETDVLIGATSTSAVAIGQGSGNFLIRLPRELAVSVGDPVFLPSISPLILGEVREIEADTSDPFSTIRFTSPLSLQGMRFVEIVTDDREDPREIRENIERADPSSENMGTTTPNAIVP